MSDVRYYQSSGTRHVCGTCMPEREFTSAENARRHVRKFHRPAVLLRDTPEDVERLARQILALDDAEPGWLAVIADDLMIDDGAARKMARAIIERLRGRVPQKPDALLGEVSIESAFRERDEFDVDVHPDSLRGQVLALYDEADRVWDASPRWLRVLARVMAWRPWR